MGATALVGAQWGSEGKGLIAAGLARHFDASVRVGGPNAGHSLWYENELYKMRGVPCGWVNPKCGLFIGAGAVVHPELLEEEMNGLPVERDIYVDRWATMVTHEHETAELELRKQIGSTAEGVGQARIAKIRRDGSAVTAEDYPWISPKVVITDVSAELDFILKNGGDVILEGTQGSGLSLHHGTQYPKATSSDTNAGGLCAEAGIAPGWVDHVMLVARTYPIRVAGPSGPMGEELDWSWFIEKGIVDAPEQTTVTKKIRRISRWWDPVFEKAVRLNKPCGVWLTFGDYIEPDIREETDGKTVIMSAAGEFARDIERRFGVPVIGIGTGPNSVAHIGRCNHGDEWEWEAY